MTTSKLALTVCTTVVIALTSLAASAQLQANFSATPVSGCAPVVVNFTDLSDGNPTQWRWDLGNGTISFLRNPSVTYFNPGTYTIKLVVRNAGESDSLIRHQYITIHDQPTVNFSASVRSGCYPLAVQFTDSSDAGTGNIAQWQWDFGDGSHSTQQNPSHVYTASGTYNVSLKVTSVNGCIKTITKLQYIEVYPGVSASFTHSNPNTCVPPVTINFTNSSSGAGTINYLWNFGDGNTSTDETPSHIYSNTGRFTVQLIASNSFGCRDTMTRNNTINIGVVTNNFTTTSPVCEQTGIVFTNTSTPAPTNVTWYFGDGTTSVEPNPTKFYSTTGTYDVKLINNFGNCTDSVTRTIEVLSKPTAAFSTTDLVSCKVPFSVSFQNQSASASGYQWIFGDGNSSTEENPVHVYQSPGVYTVILISTNANGCTDTLRRTDYISIQLPEVSILNLPQEGCAPLTNTFTASVSAIEPVADYLWDFGDGTTSTDASPVHTFGVGEFDIKLTITTTGGCIDSTTVATGIRAGIRLTPVFHVTPTVACANILIQFADSTAAGFSAADSLAGIPDRWQWSFGDGGTSAMQHPSHHYQDTGLFTIKLIVYNRGCEDSLVIPDLVSINPPIARFNQQSECSSPLVRTFTDNSIGADSWSWDFGDGSTSIEKDPVHTFPSSGNYSVMLVVYNALTGCSDTATRLMRVVDEKADFTASETQVCRNNNLLFNSTSNSRYVSEYNWNFGDGNTASGNPVSHAYQATGTYTVRLIIRTTTGCYDTLVRSQYIRVNGPTASFTSPTTISCRASNVSFQDNSTGDGIAPLTQWMWNFGDGTIETYGSGPFSHTYTASGVYNVSLTVTDNAGCSNTMTLPAAVTIGNPVAMFRSLDTATCANAVVRFTNTSSGTGLTYSWSFGDGGSHNVRNPNYSYTADGIYTVKMKITDRYGCTDSLTRENYIKVLSPVSDFNVSDTLGTCPPLIVTFSNQSQNYTGYEWDFGDGTGSNIPNPSHFYSLPGTYITKLTVRKLTCSSVSEKRIVVKGPQGSFTYTNTTGCTPLAVNFTGTTIGTTSFIWDFNDGTTQLTTDSTITYSYTRPGSYLPKMILVDAGGCLVPVTGRDTIIVKGVTAAFSQDKTTLCSPGIVSFTDSSSGTDPIQSVQWIFGDGGTSSASNPGHSYTINGLYYPQLSVITTAGCKDTLVSPVPVKVISTPRGSITRSADGCVPLTSQFNGHLSNPDTSAISWNWNFGNGHTSDIKDPVTEIFETAGQYNVELIITNSSGCADTIHSLVRAFSLPDVNAGVDTAVCEGSSIILQASGASAYNWEPSYGLSCTNCASPSAGPASETTYYLTGTSSEGCVKRDTLSINVWPDFEMTASAKDSMCFGSSRSLYASGAATYQWTPAEGLNNAFIPNPVASPGTSTVYTVTGKDAHNCFTRSLQIPIKVYPIPTIEAGEDITINAGQMADLNPVVSADVTNITWTPTGNIFRTTFPGITVKPRETTTYSAKAVNAGGCSATDNITVNVICNNANVYMPNTFSPNNDGKNDVFYPRGSGLFRIKSFKVFNRWGELVFQRNDLTPNDQRMGWDGTFKGSPLSPDVFVFMAEIICENNVVLPLKGNVTLIK